MSYQGQEELCVMGELGIPIVQRFPSGQQFYTSKQSLVIHTIQGIIFSDIPEEQNWVSQAARTKLLSAMLCLTEGCSDCNRVLLESTHVTLGTSEPWRLHRTEMSNTKCPLWS